MGVQHVLAHVEAAGIRLAPGPVGTILASPRERLTDELRELIRANKLELLAALASNTLPDPTMEARRQRVLVMLDKQPGKYAVLVDNPDTDPVILALAIRDKGMCELAIPATKFDPFALIELVGRHGATVH